jgi:glycosyltransferase involved in cell wall biosynthesis
MTPFIPRQFIFIYGLKKQLQPFHLCHFLSIESCFLVHRPERILFFYHYQPFGPYWELAKRRVVPVRIPRDHRISFFRYGLKNRSCWKYRYAHQSDFIRLEKLIEHGGVYADIDTLFVQPFPETLWRKDFVLGREGDIVCADSGEKRHSLCNALIMAKKDAPFGRMWLERMQGAFNGTWSNHSTLLPFELSRQHPRLIHIESRRSFYKHLWTQQGLYDLLQGCDEDFHGVYSMHLWAHLWWSKKRRDFSPFHSGMLTEEYIRQVDTTYNVIARRFLRQGPERPRRRDRVAVIIPTRDRPALLRAAVASLLRQSRPAEEIIIVDDGSRADCRREIEEIGAMHPSITLYHFGESKGVSAARNFGLTRASGDFVVFLDDDDLMHASALELNADLLADCPGNDIVVCRSRMFFGATPDRLPRPEGSRISPSPTEFWLIDQFNGQRLQKNPSREILRFAVPIHSIMFRRACLEGVSFQTDLQIGEERLLLLDLAHRGCRFVYHPRVLAYVRMHSGNAQLKPGATAESGRYLLTLLASRLLADPHDRFICHARLLQLGMRFHDHSVRPHLRFLLRFPTRLFLYGCWYLLIQIKKIRRRRQLADAALRESKQGGRP